MNISKSDIKLLNEIYSQPGQLDTNKFGNATIIDADNPAIVGTRVQANRDNVHPEGPYEGAYEVEFEDGDTDWVFPADLQFDDEQEATFQPSSNENM